MNTLHARHAGPAATPPRWPALLGAAALGWALLAPGTALAADPSTAPASTAASATSGLPPGVAGLAKRKMSSQETEDKALFWFRMLDRDRSGGLSWDEVKGIAYLAKEFKAADSNGDGEVTPAEIRALSKQRIAERKARERAAEAASAASAAASAP